MNENRLTPSIIAEVTGGRYIGSRDGSNNTVTGAVRDNRDVKPGNLFVCIKGERTDGHIYAAKAFEAGASCCLIEKETGDVKGACVLVESTLEAVKKLGAYYRKQFNIPIIGITGSVGKTTAKEMVAATLSAGLNVHKTEKNLNNELGVPLTLLSIKNGHEAAVVEMGISDFGEMSSLAQMVRPDIFIITNIGYSHTKELGDLQGVLRAKTEAFAYMTPQATAILNGDDSLLREYVPHTRKVTFGLGRSNDYYAENVKTHKTNKVTMDIINEKKSLYVEIPAYGAHLAQLAPAAVAAGRLLGLADEKIRQGLSRYSHVEGRSNITEINGTTLVNDCYNANPGSMKSALKSLSELDGRKVAILGDMLNLGNQSEKLHYDIGGYAAECGISLLFCCGSEALNIVKGYTDAGGKEALHYPKIDEMTGSIPEKIKKGDAVLVKASHGMHFEKLLPMIKDCLTKFTCSVPG